MSRCDSCNSKINQGRGRERFICRVKRSGRDLIISRCDTIECWRNQFRIGEGRNSYILPFFIIRDEIPVFNPGLSVTRDQAPFLVPPDRSSWDEAPPYRDETSFRSIL